MTFLQIYIAVCGMLYALVGLAVAVCILAAALPVTVVVYLIGLMSRAIAGANP